MIGYDRYLFDVEREPLIRPFAFKGGQFTEKWIFVLGLVLADRPPVVAVGGAAVLWSDPRVFASLSETGGNAVMAVMAERAARMLRGGSWDDPLAAQEQVFDALHEYGRAVTGNPDLSPTFTLNTLVSLDLALWKMMGIEAGAERWAELLPAWAAGAFSHRQKRLAVVPLISYKTPLSEVADFAVRGHPVLKIKIGHAGDQGAMIERDLRRIGEVHAVLRGVETPHSESGRLGYYLDANGRYESLEAVQRLLEGLDGMGALERTILLEEPFADGLPIEVGGLPVRVAADESLHSLADLRRRVDLGYGAVALKPAGKTLSLSLRMGAEALRLGVPCFVADSAAVPLLAEWNRLFAAHLPAFPGLRLGLMEANGAQSYRNWDALVAEHPMARAPWMQPRAGLFELDESYFEVSGGVFRPAGHYESLLGH